MKTCHLFIRIWEPRICYLHTDPWSPPPLQVLSYSGTMQLLYHGPDTKFFYLSFGIVLTIFALYPGTMQLSFLYIHYNGYYATFYSLSINVNPSPFTRRTRCYHRQHLSSFLYLPIYLFLLLGSNCFQYTHVFNCSLVKYWSPWHQSMNFHANAL